MSNDDLEELFSPQYSTSLEAVVEEAEVAADVVPLAEATEAPQAATDASAVEATRQQQTGEIRTLVEEAGEATLLEAEANCPTADSAEAPPLIQLDLEEEAETQGVLDLVDTQPVPIGVSADCGESCPETLEQGGATQIDSIDPFFYQTEQKVCPDSGKTTTRYFAPSIRLLLGV